MPNRNVPSIDNPYESNLVTDVEFTVGAEATNAINVAIQLNNRGQDLGEAGAVYIYLSDDANGYSLAASAPSSGWAIGTDGLLIPVVANKAALFISEGDGDIDITITESSAKDFYVVVVLPSGKLVIQKITFV